MSKQRLKKLFLTIGLMIILLWPPITVRAADKSHIGDSCLNDATNADCELGGADLDCENSQKTKVNGDALRYCDCGKAADCDAEYGVPATGAWECIDGADYTYNLDYCYNSATKLVKIPAGINQNASPVGKLVDAIFDTAANQAALLEEVKTFKPTVEIRLPELAFSDLANTVDEEGYLHIPWIGEFLKALYNFGLAIISIIAVVMIIMQGTKIIATGGATKAEAYKKIGQIAIGLVIAWGSYTILYTINPSLVNFNSLKIKYIKKEKLTIEYLSDSAYQSITGGIPLSKAETFKKAEEMSIAANIDPCIMQAILLTESGGNPAVIGHDENANVAKSIPSRRSFLLSGLKFSGETFTKSPGTEKDFDVNENKRKIWNDDGGKYLNNNAGAPDYGIDWRYTHGFGLGQITITGKEYCSTGVRGAKRCGKCYTIPQLLSAESSIEISICLMQKSIAAAKAAGWTADEDVMRAAFWGYAAGSGRIPKSTEGSAVLYGKKADGTRKPGDTKWLPYLRCKSTATSATAAATATTEQDLDPEPPAESDPEQS